MKALPPGYRFLDNPASVGVAPPLPKVLVEARRHFGVLELRGPDDNPSIIKWASELGISDTYNDDAIPWCGLFVAIVVKRTGRTPVAQPLWARNWAKFGVVSTASSLGDILVFKRGNGGHVGFYVGHDSTSYHVLGGNQADSVNVMRLEKSRCIAVRSPVYKNRPKSAVSVQLSPHGVLSRNEV